MPRKSLHGRTCGVSRDGRRARALQPGSRSRPHAPDGCSLRVVSHSKKNGFSRDQAIEKAHRG
ncbi:hypothetical protein C7T87_22230 [Xanthomonas hortorum pv. hederae]|nr:hypothetical protein C7T87_22230 [Xanthomonas hortorum pv. hederae]